MLRDGFEAVIGLEVHCQLATATKIFCGCSSRAPAGQSVADLSPNLNSCPICAGHPGTLPVLNRKVVEFALMAGMATHCELNLKNVFARKNYFYPDLPKGYQISQFDLPICEKGWLMIPTSSGERKIQITRIHMEEDAGKNVHLSGYSLVNLNRAGVPLIEIVSEPEMKTPEEAGAYLRALYSIVTYLGICDGNMQEGNFRCDANVSVMPQGSTQFGTRVEIKNINSFRFIEKAIDYEIARQIDLISQGGRVIQETRTYDSDQNITLSMRSKEQAEDYRYFPDPDLIPVQIEPSWVEEIRKRLPELPEQKRARWSSELALANYDSELLTSSKKLAEYFEQVVAHFKGEGLQQSSKIAANLLLGEITRLMNEESLEANQIRITPSHLAELVELLRTSVISSTGAKQVIAICWKTGELVSTIVDREQLRQVSDLGALDPIIQKVIAAHPHQVSEFKSGKEKLLGFFIGQVMKEMGGKANPGLVGERVKKSLLGEG